MWPLLPKKCDCVDSPTNQNYTCDHCGLTTNDFAFQESLNCIGIDPQDDLSVGFQKLENFLRGGR